MTGSRLSCRPWVAVLLGAGALFLALPAAAQLELAPSLRMVSLRPGTSVTFPLAVGNRSKTPLTCQMSAQDMVLDPSGRAAKAPEGYKRGCGSWVTLKPAQFRLRPGESRKVEATLKAPRGSGGGYYARLSCLARPEGEVAENRGMGIRFQFQINTALMATVTGGRLYSSIHARSIELATHPQKPGGGSSGSWEAMVTVQNTGNLHAPLEGQISVLDERGRVIARAPLLAGRGYVLAEGERVFRASGGDRLPDGGYAVVATLGPPGGRAAPATATAQFTVLRGEVQRGKPTGEMRALLNSLNPGFYVKQTNLEFSLAAGARRRNSVEILNVTGEPLQLTAKIRDWELDPSGELAFPEHGASHGRSCAGWISIAPATILVPPRGRANVSVTAALPRDAAGEHYAAIVLAPRSGLRVAEPGVMSRTTILVTARALRTEKPAATVAGFVASRLEAHSTTFRLNVRNTGNVACFAQGRVAILDSLRKVITENLSFGSEQVVVLPNGGRRFDIDWLGGLAPGGYVAVVSLAYHDGTPPISKEIPFKVPGGSKPRAR